MNGSLIQGDALTELQKLESESVDCCITSPPYWALRDYKVYGQLGLEPTIDEYINKLISIFDEVKRVLKTTGTCWCVIGDTYNSDKWGGQKLDEMTGIKMRDRTSALRATIDTIPTKSLCMIPERFSIAMIDHGWILRNKIIWYKPNCMPSSAKDRFTVDWEYVFFFVKSQKYYFETQYEPIQQTTLERDRYVRGGKKLQELHDNGTRNDFGTPLEFQSNPLGRIKRCVWKISTKPFSGAHFAVFPPDLVEPMLKAGCPEYICSKCGFMRKLEYAETRIATRPGLDVGNGKSGKHLDPNKELHTSDLSKYRQQIMRSQHELSGCDCNAGFQSGTVLDPFMGVGTTGMVTMQNARNFIGIELNPQYVAMATKRLDPWLQQERLITV